MWKGTFSLAIKLEVERPIHQTYPPTIKLADDKSLTYGHKANDQAFISTSLYQTCFYPKVETGYFEISYKADPFPSHNVGECGPESSHWLRPSNVAL